MTLRASVEGLTAPELEWSLLGTKHTHEESVLYTNHAAARGGIGNLLSTGIARGPISRLPAVTHASRAMTRSARPSTMVSSSTFGGGSTTSKRAQSAGRAMSAGNRTTTLTATFNSLGITVNTEEFGDLSLPPGNPFGTTMSSGLGGTAAPEVAKKAWEQGLPHPNNFVSTARRVRMYDVGKANKWAAMSYFETSPTEIKRHLDIVSTMDQIHAQAKYHEREDERVRHLTWAARQKEVFRRQRQESAARYRRAGVAVRETYTLAPASPSSPRDNQEQEAAEETGVAPSNGGDVLPLSVGASAYGSLNTIRPGTINPVASGYGSLSGAERTIHPIPSIPLPKPTFFKLYDRMLNESEEGPNGKVVVLARRQEEEQARQQEADISEQLRHMDDFEAHIMSLQRGRRGH